MSISEIKAAENEIMRTLKFKISLPSEIEFLRIFLFHAVGSLTNDERQIAEISNVNQALNRNEMEKDSEQVKADVKLVTQLAEYLSKMVLHDYHLA